MGLTFGVHGLEDMHSKHTNSPSLIYRSNINLFQNSSKNFLEDKFVLKFIQKGKGPRKGKV